MITAIQYENRNIDILCLHVMNLPVGGNKFFKLKYNIEEAKKQQHHTLLTFGGAFSNHLYATAIAGKEAGLRTIAVIRGEDDRNNPTLNFCREQGMHLKFISREEYRKKETVSFIEDVQKEFGEVYLLPEGGTNHLAVKGCSEILAGIETNYDLIFCAAGTGGTLAGLISTPGVTGKIIGISVLKGADTLTGKISSLALKNNSNWELVFKYHLGGYATYHPGLMQFISSFEKQFNMQLDPVYTGKVFYALFDMIAEGKIHPGQKILALHTGGLQGWVGWNYRYKK